MLDFNATSINSEKQTRSTQIRHGESLATLIERASTALGVDKSVFLRHAIAKEAQRIIETSSHHKLTPADAKLFSAALDIPPLPSPRAVEAARSYRHRVVDAD